MKALLTAILFFLAGCASSADPVANHGHHTVYQDGRSQTVFVKTMSGHGTGFIVNDKCAVTAAHVVSESGHLLEAIIVTDPVGMAFESKVAAIDYDNDVAIVCSDKALDAPAVTFLGSMPPPYAIVFTIGFPLNDSKVLTIGQYQGNSLITATSAPGNSGGGVFDDNGYVVGLVDNLRVLNFGNGQFAIFSHLVGIVEQDKITALLDLNHITYQKKAI